MVTLDLPNEEPEDKSEGPVQPEVPVPVQPRYAYSAEQVQGVNDVLFHTKSPTRQLRANHVHNQMNEGSIPPEQVDAFLGQSNTGNFLHGCCYSKCCCGDPENLKCLVCCGTCLTSPVWVSLLVAAAGVYIGTLGCMCHCCGQCETLCCCDSPGQDCHPLSRMAYWFWYCCMPPEMSYQDFRRV